MISFKSFVTAIHEAIVNASDTLMDKNISLLDKYFSESTSDVTDSEGKKTSKTTLIPKTVLLQYPHLNAAGVVENLEVAVPLITLVPLTMSQIEKAKLTADFEMEIVGQELQLHFSKPAEGFFHKKHKTKIAKLEITLMPQETSDGLKMLVEGYEAILKRQIS
jgi:hypothetical protein